MKKFYVVGSGTFYCILFFPTTPARPPAFRQKTSWNISRNEKQICEQRVSISQRLHPMNIIISSLKLMRFLALHISDHIRMSIKILLANSFSPWKRQRGETNKHISLLRVSFYCINNWRLRENRFRFRYHFVFFLFLAKICDVDECRMAKNKAPKSGCDGRNVTLDFISVLGYYTNPPYTKWLTCLPDLHEIVYNLNNKYFTRIEKHFP